MTDPEALLSLQQVTRLYGEGRARVAALAGVDLQVRAGEFVALMGPSGSGKSTTLNVLGCLDLPTTGRYLFRGVDVGALDEDGRALLRRHYLGFVFQGFNLLPRTTALENVALPLVYLRVPRSQRAGMAAAALRDVGLGDRLDHTPSMLSGGQQQRVAVARALVTSPSVLLADEPTGNLDTATSRDLMHLLAQLHRDRGLTIVMVTHEPDVAAYASRIVRFRDGLVVDDAPVVERAC